MQMKTPRWLVLFLTGFGLTALMLHNVSQAEGRKPRSHKVVNNVQAINQVVQQELARQESVLQYYELINTQWPLLPTEETISEVGCRTL